VSQGEERTRWRIHADRVVDENPHVRLSVASVELPDGTRFEQYVLRMPRVALTVVLDEDGERVLLIWRHRFILDRWVWELPGGYVDPGEDGPAAAAREVQKETGYRPRSIEHLLTFQPMTGTADSPHELYLARGADQAGVPDPNETEAVRWVPLAEIPAPPIPNRRIRSRSRWSSARSRWPRWRAWWPASRPGSAAATRSACSCVPPSSPGCA
jgi:8-oxo-dGTP pyrophosphatase MutT (NUDIX family)